MIATTKALIGEGVQNGSDAMNTFPIFQSPMRLESKDEKSTFSVLKA